MSDTNEPSIVHTSPFLNTCLRDFPENVFKDFFANFSKISCCRESPKKLIFGLDCPIFNGRVGNSLNKIVDCKGV